MQWFHYLSATVFIVFAFVAADSPKAGRSYMLYNNLPATNPYQYLAWTTDSSLAKKADDSSPGLAMVKASSADTVVARALWLFDLQDDGTYRIYNVDNSYPGSSYERLDVHADGVTPFLGIIGSTNAGQVWQLKTQSTGLEIYNHGWNNALDINGSATNPSYPLFMNAPTDVGQGGQWSMADWTPSTTLTTSTVVTQLTTITPGPTVIYVGGNQATVTSTSVTTSTIVRGLLALHQNMLMYIDCGSNEYPTSESEEASIRRYDSTNSSHRYNHYHSNNNCFVVNDTSSLYELRHYQWRDEYHRCSLNKYGDCHARNIGSRSIQYPRHNINYCSGCRRDVEEAKHHGHSSRSRCRSRCRLPLTSSLRNLLVPTTTEEVCRQRTSVRRNARLE